MNARQPIQPSNQPAVLSLTLSPSRKRFIAGLSTGLRCFRTDNCLTTYYPTLPKEGGIAIAEALDDRYLAYVGGGRSPASSPNVVVFWDALLGVEVTRFNLHEPVLGIRLSAQNMVVLLRDRAVIFEHQLLQPTAPLTPPPDRDSVDNDQRQDNEPLRGPNVIKAIHPTAPNTYALACLQDSILAMPAQSIGQVQIVTLTSKASSSKRVLRAHNSALRCLALSPDKSLIATASEQGTLLRIFDLRTLDQAAEFRRGMDHSIIYGLAFSSNNRWLACTSDKGTLHIFDLRPSPSTTSTPNSQANRRSYPPPAPTYHRFSGPSGMMERDTLSINSPSNRSSPVPGPSSHQGSIQEYYGLRPPPSSASPKPSTPSPQSALQTLSHIPFAPRALKDTRSTASTPFTTGSDPPYWQGGPAVSWTTTPTGVRKRMKHPVMPLPGEPSGKPPKGVLTFEHKSPTDIGDDEGEVLWILGGGSEAMWEVFDLGRLSDGSGGWVVERRGFRRFLTRQFVD